MQKKNNFQENVLTTLSKLISKIDQITFLLTY